MKTSDVNIKYTTESVPAIGIEKGMDYSQAIPLIVKYLVDFRTNKIKFDCDNETYSFCKEELDVIESIESIMSALTNLSSSDLTFDGDLRGLLSGVSANSGPLIGSSLDYSVTKVSNGVSFAYDFTQLKTSLPSGYNIASVTVSAYGSNLSGRTLIERSREESGSLTIPYRRLPGLVEVEVSVFSIKGDVQLKANYFINSSTVDSGTLQFDIYDKTAGETTSLPNLTDVINLLVVKVYEISAFADSMKKFNVGDVDFVSSAVGVKGQISANTAAIESLAKDLEDKVLTIGTSDC
jgi:hypothetical protein